MVKIITIHPKVHVSNIRNQISFDTMCGRKWKNPNGEYCDNPELTKNSLTAMSYNILSDACVKKMPHIYSYTNRKYFEWNKRWKLLLAEITSSYPDIMALQEVDNFYLQDYFTPNLSKLGYELRYKKNTGDAEFGCLLCWKKKKLKLEDYVDVEYAKIDRFQYFGQNVAQIGVFSLKAADVYKSLCFANTHIHFNMKRGDIKLAQIMHLLDKIDHVTNNSSIPLILCGDMNLYPHSPLYKFIRDGHANLNLKGNQELSDPLYKVSCEQTGEVHHSFSLNSVYNPSDSRISCHTHVSGKIVDYIWYTEKCNKWRLNLSCYLQLPKRNHVEVNGGIPSSNHPSDHFPLMCVFEFDNN